MNSQTSQPKQHHYVPKSYLKRFVGADGFLRIYERSTGTYRRQRPKEAMRINSYYRQLWAPEGVDPNIMETTLGEWLEPEAKTALDRLIDAPELLTDGDTANLLTYLEVQRIRVPRQADAAKAAMREALLKLVPPHVGDEIVSGKLTLTIKDGARFEAMRALIGKLGPWFGSMEWEVATAADDAAFVTTDSPVAFYHPQLPPPAEAGISLAGTMVFFPLNSRRTLVMRHTAQDAEPTLSPMEVLPTPEHRDGHLAIIVGGVWSRQVVDEFNWKMVQLSSNLVVAESEDVLRRCI